MKRHGETQWILTQKTGRNDAFKKGRRKEDRKGTTQRLDRTTQAMVFPGAQPKGQSAQVDSPDSSLGRGPAFLGRRSGGSRAEVTGSRALPRRSYPGPATSPPSLRLQSYVQSFWGLPEAPRLAQPLGLCSCCLDILPSSFTLLTAGPQTRACKQIISLGCYPWGAGTAEELNREVGGRPLHVVTAAGLVRRVTGSRVCVSQTCPPAGHAGESLCCPSLGL